MITINLKEVFAVDSQSDLASKLNFNFNQLLALGFGQTGPTGPAGPVGPAGPIGPIGETGTAGSQIFSTSGGTMVDLLSENPVDAIIGDYYIAGDAIYRKTTSSPGQQWETVSNFNTIFSNIASVGTSTWQLGLAEPSAVSKFLAPIKANAGYDRVNELGSSGNFNINSPNWRDADLSYTNSQIMLYNFDPKTVKTYTSSNSDQNGYSVNITPDRLGTGGNQAAESAFPYSSLLSLYSFYNTAASANEANQFDQINGSSGSYRHQIELGSVDELPETIVSTSSEASFVVSPTWQNLRVRKYRTSVASLPGGSLINADFNLHSADSSAVPSLNSRFTWRINKKTSSTSGLGTNLILALSNSTTEQSAAGLTGIPVDGLHLRGGTSGQYKLAFGIDPNNSGSVKNAVISSDSTPSLDTVVLRNMSLQMVNSGSSATSSYSAGGITSNRGIQITSSAVNADITVSNGASGRSINILSPATGSRIYLGFSTSNVSSNNWSTSSGYAIKIARNRLAAAIPFPVSDSALPTASSNDQNALDEYLELDFTPTISWENSNLMPVPAANVLSASSPTIADEAGRFIKIGRLVHFTVRFSISGWQALLPSGALYSGPPSPIGKAYRDTRVLDYGNLSTSTTRPFSGNSLGTEPYWLRIRNIPNHWPALGGYFGSGYLNVDVSTKQGEPGLRGNPFAWSYGGSGTKGNAGSSGFAGTGSAVWPPLHPGSLHGVFTTYSGSNKLPQIQLFGNRRLVYGGTAGTSASDAVSPVKSRVSIYDFLTPYDDATKVFVTVQGSYITDHQTALQAGPAEGTDPAVEDASGGSEINQTL